MYQKCNEFFHNLEYAQCLKVQIPKYSSKKLTIESLLTESWQFECQMTSKSELLENINNFAEELWILIIISSKCRYSIGPILVASMVYVILSF